MSRVSAASAVAASGDPTLDLLGILCPAPGLAQTMADPPLQSQLRLSDLAGSYGCLKSWISYLRSNPLSDTNNTMSLAIVTGGATGIGAAAVRKYASEGYDVALLDVNQEKSLKLSQEERPGSVAFFETDVRSRNNVEASVASAVAAFGPPSVLFANAGVQRLSSLFELRDEDIDAVIDTNLKGTIYTVAAVAQHMREAGEGSIVLMASDQVFAGKPGSIAYGASKGGVGQLAKSLSLELSPLGIRINAICPATVKTPLTDKIFEDLGEKEYAGDTEAAWKAEAESIPLGRIASPEEIAKVVYFLSSPEASFMTGSLVTVDGGFTAQ